MSSLILDFICWIIFDINFVRQRNGKILGPRKEFSLDFQECLLYDQFSRRWWKLQVA